MRIKTEFPLTLSEICRAIGAQSHLSSKERINAIVTDSREASHGDLFVALDGVRASGEEHTEEARERGAYILSAQDEAADLKTSDTASALLRIAAYYKTRLPYLKATVAITGSVGKTTTKNILKKILSESFKVHATEANYNNILGLSHTILTAHRDTEILICELGMNHAGEISVLSRAAAPDLSIITNVGTAHIGNLGSRESIAKAKLEIIDGMNKPRLIIPYEEKLLSASNADIYTFSTESADADFYLFQRSESQSCTSFDIKTPKYTALGERIFLPGRHILNAVAASIGAAELLGASRECVLSALERINDESTRGRYLKIGKFTVYDDTYSSSPEAVIADLKLLSLTEYPIRSCVLGDMLELGEHSARLHEKIGRELTVYGFTKLYAFGKYAQDIERGALAGGMRSESIFLNTDLECPELTARQILENSVNGELILVKASHSVHAERIYEFLK